MANANNKKNNSWVLKIFFITLIISAGVSVVAKVFMSSMPVWAAVVVLLVLIGIGILFDIIGVAFASCPETPFVSMASRKIKKGVNALKLLKKAEMVSNIFNDVVGDVCGIVSGSCGAAIGAKVILDADTPESIALGVVISAFISAVTVAGKALGKTIALKNDIVIVEMVGGVYTFFVRDKKKKDNGEEKA